MFQTWGKIALICCKIGAKYKENCSKIGASGEYFALKRGQVMNVLLQKRGQMPPYRCFI